MCWGFQITVTDDGNMIEDRCVDGIKEFRELAAAHGFQNVDFLYNAGDDGIMDEDSCLCGIDTSKACLLIARVVINALGWFDWLDDIEIDDIDPARVIGHLIKEGIGRLTTVGFSSDTKMVVISWL